MGTFHMDIYFQVELQQSIKFIQLHYNDDLQKKFLAAHVTIMHQVAKTFRKYLSFPMCTARRKPIDLALLLLKKSKA